MTPLKDGGRSIDPDAIAPLVGFLSNGGVDGLLACGTTGEGVLLSVDERRHVAEAFLAARPDGFQVAIHAGAQTTRDTVALAAHALEIGADAVAVIAPPYFPLGARELFDHLRSAADACDPLPFYVYEFAARSGYAIPVDVDPAARARTDERRRPEGERHAVRRDRALSHRRHGRVHRLRTLGPSRDGTRRGRSGLRTRLCLARSGRCPRARPQPRGAPPCH